MLSGDQSMEASLPNGDVINPARKPVKGWAQGYLGGSETGTHLSSTLLKQYVFL